MDRSDATTAVASAAMSSPDVRTVNLWLSDDAKKLLADNMKFNPDLLRSMIERTLSARGLIKPDSTQTLDVEITGFRTRSNFSAIMFGFMAGADSIEGMVTLKDPVGRSIKRAKVNASYALGGIAGGQDSARMDWLYEEFSKHTAAEVSGNQVK